MPRLRTSILIAQINDVTTKIPVVGPKFFDMHAAAASGYEKKLPIGCTQSRKRHTYTATLLGKPTRHPIAGGEAPGTPTELLRDAS